jgi:hypothetical protein
MECDSTVQGICSRFNCTAECIQQHVEYVWHMTYSLFVTLHQPTSHDSKGFGMLKINLTCYRKHQIFLHSLNL